jgi:hypothetical protein
VIDQNEPIKMPTQRLGRLPAKGDERAVRFATIARVPKAPDISRPFRNRQPFPRHNYNNDIEGNCTRAKQAIASVRMERIERRRTITIAASEVTRVYRAMTARLYGGGDTGAYETDALSEWRRPEFTFVDDKGRPLTIDAYTRVNHLDINEVKYALHIAPASGLAICSNMPNGWKGKDVWEAPIARSDFVGDWAPGTWGGHSMWSCPNDKGLLYNPDGFYIQTWDMMVFVTWAAWAAYFDEAHNVIDSVNAWKKKLGSAKFNAKALINAVNAVSSQQIAA